MSCAPLRGGSGRALGGTANPASLVQRCTHNEGDVADVRQRRHRGSGSRRHCRDCCSGERSDIHASKIAFCEHRKRRDRRSDEDAPKGIVHGGVMRLWKCGD